MTAEGESFDAMGFAHAVLDVAARLQSASIPMLTSRHPPDGDMLILDLLRVHSMAFPR